MKQCMIPRLRNRLLMACPGAAYTCARARLLLAGLSETRLRQMDPDQRVTVLEQAHLDPYDYLYLAW